MKNNESEEMYLESILLIEREQGAVRAVDICENRGLAKSSVSKALGLLVKKDLICVDGSGKIILTELGRNRAENIYTKHKIISEAFVKLGVSEEVAEENACRIEHVITEDLFEVLKRHIENNCK